MSRWDTPSKMRANWARYDHAEHPARFSKDILAAVRVELGGITKDWEMEPVTVLDPFCGVGGIHLLRYHEDRRPIAHGEDGFYWTLGVEIEREWSRVASGLGPTATCDWFAFRWKRENWDDMGPQIVVTSPTYGNRMADKHEARDDSTRRTYKHMLGRELSEGNSGGLQWGEEYRKFHLAAWDRVWGMLDYAEDVDGEGGYLVLNVKDHVRAGEVQKVVDWHCDTLLDLGFRTVRETPIETKGYGFGSNRELRVDCEWLVTFVKSRKGLEE